MYKKSIWNAMSSWQRSQVYHLKKQNGWINSATPPQGYSVDPETGTPIPSQERQTSRGRIGAVQFDTNETQDGYPPLPPPPHGGNPPSVITAPSTAGSSFGRTGTRQPSSASILTVTINGQVYEAVQSNQNNRV